jgi:hypothetical protein
VPIGHETSRRELLQREQDSGIMLRLERGSDLNKPQIRLGRFGACEKRQSILRRVEELNRGVSKESSALRPDKWRDPKESMRERRLRQKVD